MKKILAASVAMFAVHVATLAQTITVVDNITMEPVISAFIYAHAPTPLTKQWGTVTNEKGLADISAISTSDSLYVRHPNYGLQGFSMQTVKQWKYTIRLTQREILMYEVVFSANKGEEEKADVPYSIEVIDSKDVAFSNPQTTGDMLLNTGQVFVQKSQMGGSSPVIRGFEASRVLMVIDGVRMNNAIYRAGHLQDCITIDPNTLERTEVIFGPSSTMYGSDALGGTMHFYSRKPLLSLDDSMYSSARGMLRYSSANNEQTGHVDVNFGWKKWALLTSITQSSFGDLRMGANGNPAYGNYDWCRYYVVREDNKDSVYSNSNPLIQKFSGYTQLDLNQKILFQPHAKVSHLLNLQYSTSSAIPRYDRLQQMLGGLPRFAEWSYGPQNRLFGSYTLAMQGDSAWYDQAKFIAAFQKIDQDRITRRRDNVNRNSQEEDVMVFSLNADFAKELKKNELRYGMELTHNIVNSTATNTDITTGTITDAVTRYPDGGSTMSTAAIYLSHSWEISEKLILSDGIRFTYTNLHSQWSDTTFYPFPFSEVNQTNFSPSGNLGLVYRPSEKFNTHLMFSTGFRSPNVDDMSKVFESISGTLVVPNPELNPEMVIGAEWGFDVQLSPGVHFTSSVFYSSMFNAIVIRDFQLNGQDSVLFDGSMSKVVAAQNVNNAFITGFSSGLYADFNEHFSFRSTVTATYGRYEDVANDTVVPLDHIPPVFGQTGLVFHSRGLEAEIFTRYNGWKHLSEYSPSGEDNAGQATAYGTPAWATLNIRGTYQVNKYLGLSFACENILDQNFRNFASGISAPGRNVIVALRLRY